MRIDPNQKLSENFTLGEFLASDVAKKKNINNMPTLVDIYHMTELCKFLLQPIRDAWGAPIKITSGFRCKTLNDAVGGSKTSAHLRGYGVDIKPASGKYEDFEKFVIEFLQSSDLKWDQAIKEQTKNGRSKWVHLGFRNSVGQQRMQLFDLVK